MRFRLPIHYLLFSACCGVSIKAATDWHFSGVNIAYGKTATQGPDTYSQTLSSGTKNYTADLAVDGNNSTKMYDGSCTHTIGLSSTDAFWTLELQKGYKITGIVIYNRERTDMRIRLKNFIIYGNESVVLHNSIGTSEYKKSVIYIPLNETRYFSSITVKLPAHRGFSASGYYYLALCEVEIYAATCEYMNITNGEMKPNQSLYEVNAQAHIVCNEGFKPQTQSITCNNSKEWTFYEPCSRVFCAFPGNPINGDYLKENAQNHLFNFTSPLPYGSAITVKCDQGYRSKNTEIRTCQNDGTWSGEALCVQESANQKTSTALVIGGISGAAILVVMMISGLVVYLVRRRKRILKDREELMTYTDLRQSQIGPSSGDYAELNVRGLEDGISSKGEMPSGSEHAVYYNY